MGLRLFRRTKTLLLTFGLFSLGFYLILNTLAVEFSAESTGMIGKHPRDLSLPKEKSKLLNEFQANFVVKGQRKPKTMNLEGDDHTEENLVYERRNKIVNENKKIQNQPRPQSIKSDRDTVKFLQKHYRHDKAGNENADNGGEKFDDEKIEDDYEEENDDDYDDNDEDYDEDNDDNDDDDADNDDADNDDYDYDDATNAPFKPGDFGDIRGLEYYKKPKLKYAEVDAVQKRNPDDNHVLKHLDNDVVKAEEKPEKVLTNGMFWSEYVESLLPKGKFLSLYFIFFFSFA
jgi:hypothetical protein